MHAALFDMLPSATTAKDVLQCTAAKLACSMEEHKQPLNGQASARFSAVKLG
jgi:hypothetical protein